MTRTRLGGLAVDRFPLEETPENEGRFTIGLLADASKLICERFGFTVNDMSHRDWARLQQSLYRLLFVEEN